MCALVIDSPNPNIQGASGSDEMNYLGLDMPGATRITPLLYKVLERNSGTRRMHN